MIISLAVLSIHISSGSGCARDSLILVCTTDRQLSYWIDCHSRLICNTGVLLITLELVETGALVDAKELSDPSLHTFSM